MLASRNVAHCVITKKAASPVISQGTACRAIEGFRRRMARERTMRFRRSYLRYGAANAAKCGATTPERLWQSQRPSCETRLRNKSWAAIVVHASMLASARRRRRNLGQRTRCAWRRTRHCAIFVENVVFLGGLTFRAIKMSAAAFSFYTAARVAGLVFMTVLPCS